MTGQNPGRKILFVAAENGALKGAKVGGIADVVRDLPRALAQRGWQVTVITPGYGTIASHNSMEPIGQLGVSFHGLEHQLALHRLDRAGVESVVVDHALITRDDPGQIYHHDKQNEPFATDATRFALFATAAATWAREQSFDIIHLHDWHAAPLAILRAYSPEFSALQQARLVFTIHNLALQGIRPLRGHSSSLFEWFPTLEVMPTITDPRWPDCVNLMRAGINLCDRVNTVSKTYAREILEPDDPEMGFHGGEGLEADLRQIADSGRLAGIQNGCDYPDDIPGEKLPPSLLLDRIKAALFVMAAESPVLRTAHMLALARIDSALQHDVKVLITSIGRLTAQKFGLLQQELDGRPVLHHLLGAMKPDSLMLVLGTGTPDIEMFLTRTAAAFENLIFVNGFGETLADDIYRSGQLFLMPSTFEPSGLSQLLAMRAGQPCLVHAVGGLQDTVTDGKTGWTFAGDGPEQQARQLTRTFSRAYAEAQLNTNHYQRIRAAATAVRFSWNDAAREYEELYQGP
ncbi:MAG: glycogen synthase [Pseudomonadota bacterium]